MTADPEREAAVAAYERYLEVSNTAANRGDPEHSELSEVAIGPALAEARRAIRSHAENGRVYSGSRIAASAEVVSFDLEAPQGEPQAVIEACLDITDYVLTYVESGDPVDVDRGLEMYLVTVNLHLVEDRWMVVAIDAHRETPCE